MCEEARSLAEESKNTTNYKALISIVPVCFLIQQINSYLALTSL